MFTKVALGLAITVATVSGTLAATKTHSAAPNQNQALGQSYTVYNPAGAYVGADPDLNIRFELFRDWGRGH